MSIGAAAFSGTPGPAPPIRRLVRGEAGGGGFNAARALALLGHDVTMVSVAGGDSGAALVEAAAARTGVTLNGFTFLDRQTPSYTAILEADGNLVIALADMGLYDLMTARRLKVNWLRETLEQADFILCDANLPGERRSPCSRRTHPPPRHPHRRDRHFAAKIVRLIPALPALDFVFMNEAEQQQLQRSPARRQTRTTGRNGLPNVG